MNRQTPSATRVRIAIGGKSIEATLADSEAAGDFAPLAIGGIAEIDEPAQTPATSTRLEIRSTAVPCVLFLSFGSTGGTGQ
jgi:hypothetical protein